ncbi:MAG: glycosyltransferase [Bdellovibrionales bacterium]|nr:galactosyltransferase-related protein [Bdellovibrionales bacterium]NQZ18547.1 glycosyltransferase [Bdellovibrionales bacterium]
MALKECHKINDEVEVIGPVVGPNISAMRNFGASQANGEWVLFVDHDCHYNIDKVLKIIETLKDQKDLAAFSGVYKQTTTSLIQKTYDRIQRLWVLKGADRKGGKHLRMAHNLLGGCLVVRKSVWEKLNGFNETIGWGGEETEFIQRIHSLGYKTAVSYSWRVQHDCKIGLFGFMKRAWMQNFNRGLYQIKSINDQKSYQYKEISVFNRELSRPLILTVFASVSLLAFWSGTLISLLKS